MAMEFALISRINAAAQPFGEDSVQLFHNLMGVTALGFILAHPILLGISGYAIGCWLNPLAACATAATRTATLALYLLLALIIISVWRKQLRIRYEAWYVMHGLFALIVLGAALVHIFIVGRYTSTMALKVVWILYAALVLGMMLWFKILTPIRNWNKKWAVVENRVEAAIRARWSSSRSIMTVSISNPVSFRG